MNPGSISTLWQRFYITGKLRKERPSTHGAVKLKCLLAPLTRGLQNPRIIAPLPFSDRCIQAAA